MLRAQQRADALVAGNMAGAYEFLSPGTRSTLSLEAYRASVVRKFWKAAKVDGVKCVDLDVCKVDLIVTYDLREIKSISSRLTETWLRESGRWWFVPRK